MKNITIVTKHYVIDGNDYKVMQFTSETEAEKHFGDKPFIAVHSSYTEKDLPLNGGQMLISRDFQEVQQNMKLDAACRNFKKANPDAIIEELCRYMMTLPM